MPFCSSICSYCDFCKFIHDEIWASEYLVHLEKEIKKKAILTPFCYQTEWMME